jgi:hypothetical protein
MAESWLWLLLALSLGATSVLLMWHLRLRMEVWANRRVIAALEAAGRTSEPKGRSRLAEWLAWAVILWAVWELRTLWIILWIYMDLRE